MYSSVLRYKSFGDPHAVLCRETFNPGSLATGQIRVRMRLSPVNASDLIPITGAYRHRITLPATAGHEGVGEVIDAPASFHHLLGRRVLPLRGQGTWQQIVDCPAALAVPVPDDIDDSLAARAWINPLAAKLMLKHFPCAGQQVIVTAAGSDCALYLGQWALQNGAQHVAGIYRSAIHASRLAACGITPVNEQETDIIREYARSASVIYDATGGPLAETLLHAMPVSGQFVSYGLLSGKPFPLSRETAAVHWFHMRHYLGALSADDWQQVFRELWAQLKTSQTSGVSLVALQDWRQALTEYHQPGRVAKPMLVLNED